jgi:extracellular elastinolytic metalloproteinase
VAAVLAMARGFAAASAAAAPAPTRTVRFVLFNAEEQGLIGSQAYARRTKSRGEAVAAVWQMDMIGYNKVLPRSWEAHAGFEPSPAVEARSRRLAELLRDTALRVSPELPEVQVYHSATAPDGDPASGRSDHAAFQAQGYPAIVVSEDFFVGPGPDAPAPQENPNYHRPGDTFVAEDYAAAIARAIAAAAWVSTSQAGESVTLSPSSFTVTEPSMPGPREFDSRKQTPVPPTALAAPAAMALSQNRTNEMTGTPVVVPALAAAAPAEGTMVERALAFVRNQPASFGFAPGQPAEFVPDPIVQRTSAGAAAVHLKQDYHGIPVFQMTRAVRFDPEGKITDAAGDSAPIPPGLKTAPQMAVQPAVLKAAEHLATTGVGVMVKDMFGETNPLPTVDVKGYTPTILAAFPLASRPTVLDKGPFENVIPAHLVIFNQRSVPRLAWYTVFTFPGYTDQYAVIVAADKPDGEVLYCKSTMRQAAARGHVFEFSPGVADRRFIDFPRPVSDYPDMPGIPLAGFPADWVSSNQTVGNSTVATLNFSSHTLTGTVNGGVVVFDPQNPSGDDQKLLNIFYFCNYMHDFLYMLGFDEAGGNFQQVNFTHIGAQGDPVQAHAHPGPVVGTANMATGPDGLPPVMNMGLVASTGRHTAFDADVVFHEYTHGLTNRTVVGGRLNAPHSLESLQSGMMGEGWSDYYAMTIQNFFRAPQEKFVLGDWVVDRPGGIRRAPYDDNYPFTYDDLASVPEVHAGGEVWCATLMMMTRRIRAGLGSDQQGYRLCWQIVTDALKLTPANPSFLDARDAIVRAVDDLATAGRIPPATHDLARRAAWQAFAHFGMGVNASSGDSDSVDSIVADSTLPPGI